MPVRMRKLMLRVDITNFVTMKCGIGIVVWN